MSVTSIQFKAFAGQTLQAELLGDAKNPAVLMILDAASNVAEWRRIADALLLSGRHVVMLYLRTSGAMDAASDYFPHVDDMRAILAQMLSRPVIMAAGRGAAIALRALQQDGAHLAAGLISVDLHADDGLDGQNMGHIPSLYIAGGLTGLDAVPRHDGTLVSSLISDVPLAKFVQLDAAEPDDVHEALLGQLLEFLELYHPRDAREFRSGSDPRTLRDAMGLFATGVTIVTAVGDNGDAIGMTANSFTSVSLDPPLLLVCIAKSAGSAPHLQSTTKFGVNVLQIGQQPASNRFASKVEDRFAGIDWTMGETGVPLLDGSLVSFECERQTLHDAGDHFILVGHVMRAQFEPHRDPLLFFRGKYRRLHFA
ncbi:flavin reductase [Sphingopyxis yananensis]|uniref:flavin reductase n=1 Tax=Sphingopyxis yananensis TaxID=2886687 RepID=UPI001D129A59|nr:flavin reductase [Sphingopyxis yananensis]MCC2601025.1 flavin reductase [Sphingopyxis yananensis]